MSSLATQHVPLICFTYLHKFFLRLKTPVNKFLTILVLSLLFITRAVAEDNDEAQVDSDEDIFVDKESDTDWLIGLAFSLIFGFFITLFGAIVAYVSIMEDILMRRYIREGELIRGDVISADFARGGGQVGVCTQSRQAVEYITFVEYERKLSSNYTVRLRKQMKATETDFVRPLLPGSAAMLKTIKVELGGLGETTDLDASTQMAQYEEYVEDGPVVNKERTTPSSDSIELYVLPDHPRSALPRRQVERACSYRYRLSTLGLIVFSLALTPFWTSVAAQAIADLEDTNPRIGWIAISICFAMIALQVPLIHCCLKDMILNALREQYLDSGEFVPIDRDDSSLSTSGSDAYLSRTRCRVQ